MAEMKDATAKADAAARKAVSRSPCKTSNATTVGSVGITLTSAPSLRRPTPKEEDVAAARAAAAAAAVAAARSRERTTPRRARTPDDAREVSGTQEKVNLAVRTSLAGR